jgi:hypothetical protein
MDEPGQLSRYSDVLDSQGLIPGRGNIFGFSTAYRPALVPTQPPISWISCASFAEGKAARCEGDQSPSPSADVKNVGAIPPLRIRLHGSVFN